MVRGKQAETAEKKAAATRKTVAEKKSAGVVAKEQEEVQEAIETENTADVSAEVGEDEVANDPCVEGDQEIENGEGDQEIEKVEGDQEIENVEADQEIENVEGDQEIENVQDGDKPANVSQEDEDQENSADEGEENARGRRPKLKPMTEEDVAYINEILTTEKVKLSDDTEELVFSYGPKKPQNGGLDDFRLVSCHLCRLVCLPRAANIKAHLESTRHTENKVNIDAERFKKPFLLHYCRDANTREKQFQIYNGENIEIVTPEYEDRVVYRFDWEIKAPDEETAKLLADDPIYEYNKNNPVLGLDYVYKTKLQKKTKYFCALCGNFVPLNEFYEHMTGIDHQATYVIKHFPNLYEKVIAGLTMKDEKKETCARNIFRKLYRDIEMKHGLKKMIHVDGYHFQRFRSVYVAVARRSPHYSEDTMEFTDAEVNDLIKKSNNNKSVIRPDPPTLRTAALGPLKRKAVDDPEAPENKSSRINYTKAELAKWRQYKIAKDNAIEHLKLLYKRYRQRPESHSDYKEEWSKFWHQRCEELKEENIDPATYNFKKDWLPKWERRLSKMYQKDIRDRKATLRNRFGLPDDRRTPSPLREPNVSQMGNQQIIGSRPNISKRNNLGPVSMDVLSNLASLISSQQNINDIGGIDGFGSGGPNRRQVRGARRGAGNMLQAPMQQDHGRQQMRQQPMQLKQEQPQWRQQQQAPRNKPALPPRRGPVDVISVLRILTALEDQLGSLGPKSVQLLSKALLCEKNKQTKQLLTDSDCYVLFATAKEKLKGQLMANVVVNTRLHAVNAAIEDLNKIINIMDRANRNQGNSSGNDSFGSSFFGGSNNAANMQSIGDDGGYNDNYNGNSNMDNANRNFSNSNNYGGGGNYPSNYDFGNFSNNNSLSSFLGGNDSGSYNNGSSSFGAWNTRQFNSGNYGSNDNFTSMSSPGGGGGSYYNKSQKGNWMTGSGSVYSNNTGRFDEAPLFGNKSSSFSLSSNRNVSFGLDTPGGKFRRF